MVTKATNRLSLIGLDRAALLVMHRNMVLARELDDAEARLQLSQKTYFSVSGAGHEAVQAAAGLLLKPGYDWFYPYYRDRTLALALGVDPCGMILQAMGKPGDPSTGGRQMPCHYGSPELHIVNQSSPTGTQYLQAVGTAEAGLRAAQLKKAGSNVDGSHAENGNSLARADTPLARRARTSPSRFQLKSPPARVNGKSPGMNGSTPAQPPLPEFGYDEVVFVSGGEGSTSQGEFYEAISAASMLRLPVLFLIEDNGLAISVPVDAQTPGGNIAALFRGYPDLMIQEIDGVDPVESYRGLRKAVHHCRSGKGPALVHAQVVRLQAHSGSDDDEAYRAPEERAASLARDPIALFEEMLLREGSVTPLELKGIRREISGQVEAAVNAALTEPAAHGSLAALHVVNSNPVVSVETPASEEGEPLTIVKAIHRTLTVEMERDPRILVFGEDVADHSAPDCLAEVPGKGGVFKVTQGLQRRHGSERVFNTPIAEAAIVGRSLGLAVRGFLPVGEIQFQDYIWPAMHQLRNEVSMLRWRSDGHFACPMVLRIATGGYLAGGGPYHTQSAESIFCHCPGLRVVMPSNARDAVGLLRTSLRCGDPVLFFEHKHLYRQSYARAPYPGDDYVIPLGKARCVRSGRDLTAITYGATVERSLRAAEELAAEGIEVEVIDLRSLAPYDWDAIRASVERTHRVVVVHEDQKTHGYGAEIAARIADELFSQLDAPVGRVGALDVPVAYSPILEEATLPTAAGIAEAFLQTRAF